MLTMLYFASIISFLVCVNGRTDLLNSVEPTNSCYNGAYRVKVPPFDECSGFRKCEVGHYCVDGVKTPCPAGYFGNAGSLNSSLCSGLCPSGFYCPVGTSSPVSFHCGSSNLYCPEGSKYPTIVSTGYFTFDSQGSEDLISANSRSAQKICPRGYFCTAGLKQPCPGGTYGSIEGLGTSACSGVCPEGWYCPAGSTQPYQYSCISGLGAAGERTGTQYCPEGSTRPTPTAEGYYTVSSHVEHGGGFGAQVICPRGSYCQEGLRHLCPAGRYGVHIREINASCTGPCTAGYYCPEGSISDKQIQCPDAASYCPASSSLPVPVSAGHYTFGHEPSNYTFDVANFGGNFFSETARTNQTICEPGYYCLSDGNTLSASLNPTFLKLHLTCSFIALF